MQKLNFLSPHIYIAQSAERGRGVFTDSNIRKNTIIEVVPVIVMSKEDRSFIDKTLLHDYIFEWGDDHKQCCMALGYIPLYNHSYEANCEYEMYFSKEVMAIKTIRAVKAGEELFINYNGQWNNPKKVWFDTK